MDSWCQHGPLIGRLGFCSLGNREARRIEEPLPVVFQIPNGADIAVVATIANVAAKHMAIGRDHEFGDGWRSPALAEDAGDDKASP